MIPFHRVYLSGDIERWYIILFTTHARSGYSFQFVFFYLKISTDFELSPLSNLIAPHTTGKSIRFFRTRILAGSSD